MTGDEFRAWRERHRLTQDQAATITGVSRECVSRWEHGRFAVGATVARLCQAWDRMKPEQRKAFYAWCGRQE